MEREKVEQVDKGRIDREGGRRRRGRRWRGKGHRLECRGSQVCVEGSRCLEEVEGYKYQEGWRGKCNGSRRQDDTVTYFGEESVNSIRIELWALMRLLHPCIIVQHVL